MITRVPLLRVFDNPFQTRHQYLEIDLLAESIRKMKATRPETSGLMQVPTGRLILPLKGDRFKIIDPEEYGGVLSALGDEERAFIQIAFAHRRLRAFHLLADLDPDYQTFPIEIIPLSDEQMADLAWEENHKRKDLSPIEEGVALQQAMAIFGLNQTQIGQRWGLSQPAVANKIRLLDLPNDAQEAINLGQLTERHGRALLAARAKSPLVYAKTVEHILPGPPVPEPALKTAEELVNKHRFYESTSTIPDAICTICNTPVPTARYIVGGEEIYLCKDCYRAGSHWSPPSAGETEKLVHNFTHQYSVKLNQNDFPLDLEITPLPGPGGKLTMVRAAACTACPYRDGNTCYDRDCHELKQRAWRETQVGQLKARLQQDYGLDPGQVTINYNYTGHTLNKHSCDPELIKPGGPCAPGACTRLQFHYTSYSTADGLKPYPDLPFTFQCNHTGAHNAARRRYEESQRSQDQKTEAAQAAEQLKSHKDQAKTILAQAEASLAKALFAHHPGAWQLLAHKLGEPTKSGDDAETCLRAIASALLSEQRANLTSKWFPWDKKGLTRFQKLVQDQLDKYGIARLPQLLDITTCLDDMWEFLYNGRMGEDPTITIEQIEGNRINLEKIVDQLHQLRQAGLLQEPAELIKVTNQIRENLDELWQAAADIDHPLPQDWGISLEMDLSTLTQGGNQ